MSNEEAKDRFISFKPFCDDRSYACDDDCKLCIDTEKKIIEALEKQIPKKAIYINYDGKDGNNRCICPNCGKLVFAIENGDILYGHMADYCEWCGQSLEWEECRGKSEGFCDVCMEKRCDGGETY